MRGKLDHDCVLFVQHPLEKGQSEALYRALKRYGVETELVIYPREGHGLKEEKHVVDRLSRPVAWFDKHLK